MENQQEQNNNEESYVVEPEEGEETEKPGRKDKLKQEIERLKKEKEEYLEGWQRERAAFANFRKDEDKRVDAFRSAAVSDIFFSLIELLDSLELAEIHAPKEITSNAWFSGIVHIQKQMQQILARYAVVEIPAKEGDRFQADAHEAIEQVASDKQSGTILEVLQKGYRTKDKVLRPARVKVAQ